MQLKLLAPATVTPEAALLAPEAALIARAPANTVSADYTTSSAITRDIFYSRLTDIV